MLKNILKGVADDINIYTFTEPLEALEFFKSGVDNGIKFNAIFLDYNMPDLNGVELFAEMEKYVAKKYVICLKQYCDILTIITANSEIKHQQDYKDNIHIGYDVILKPYTRNELEKYLLR